MFNYQVIKRVYFPFLFFLFCRGLYFCDVSEESAVSASDKEYAFAQIDDGSSVTASLDLNGTWQFKATDEEAWQPAVVPSTVWSDLIRNGRLEDPFYRDNELKVQWVEQKEWEYRRTFEVDASFLRHDKIILDCRGLDTIAELYLNGELIAKTENMFIEYEFDVKPYLRVGENEIHIIFRNILEWDKQKVESNPEVLWSSSKGRTFFSRKEGSDFGWDWGVRLVTCGIWRSIRLAAYDVARLTDLGVRFEESLAGQDLRYPEQAELEIIAEIEDCDSGRLDLELRVLLEGELVASKQLAVNGKKVKGSIRLAEPQVWWPNGWGAQPLYTVAALLKRGDEVIHSKSVRIGLRTVAIVREKDERGESFGIKVNGFLLFCKGANWVPADALPDRLTVSHYRHLLQSCQQANMNMLRLWGGGLYEPDIFYDYCDEYGILIWHDFMFAVGPYLAESSYLENVRREIGDVVRRLRHHPSIALWCGNNEQESGMPAWIEQWATVTWEDFDKIFYEVIPQTAARYDPDRPYWPGSPHHPLNRERDDEGWEAESGDAHIWDIWHGGQPFSWYVENVDLRFVSEFGFQSLPVMETIRSFTAPEDRYFISMVLDHHNKAGHKPNQNIGNMRIARYMSTMFKMPKDLENWVYVSQVMHAEGMKIATEAYRRNFPETSGALYWQLNDNWPTISGSSIDYYGRWKALHYLARHFFSPILVSGWVEGTKVKIRGINDLLEDRNMNLHWSLSRFDGAEVKSGTKEVELPANQSTLIAELDFQEEVGENPEYITYRKDSYENRRQFYLAYKLFSGDTVLSSNVAFFVPQKYLALREPEIEYRIERVEEQLLIYVSAKRFAAYVELGLKNSYARFSDNYFHLLPGEEKAIGISDCEVPQKEFRSQFYVKSLVDSYK